MGVFVILFQSTLRDLHVVCCFARRKFWWRYLHWQSRSYYIGRADPTYIHCCSRILCFILFFFVGCQVFGFPVLGCMERVCFVFLGVLTAPAAALQLQHLHGHAQQPTEGEDLRAAAPGARQVVQGPTQQGWHPSELICGWCSGCEFSYAHKSLFKFGKWRGDGSKKGMPKVSSYCFL